MAKVAAKKLCFVIGPIGTTESDDRIHADWLLEEIIQPVFREFPEFNVVRADQISQPGMIDAQIIQHLLDADLVVADLSGENANAFYEIGIRHMIQKPIIHMQRTGETIPFDVSLYRATRFSRVRPADIRKARDELKRAVQAVVSDDYKVDNPVTRVRGQIRLAEHATPEQKVMLDQLSALASRVERLEIPRRETVLRRTKSMRSSLPVRVTIRSPDYSLANKMRLEIMEQLEKLGFGYAMGQGTDGFEFHVREDVLQLPEWAGFITRVQNAPGVYVSVDLEP